jgi:murein L,D-transpeptidase YafK
LTKWVEIPRSPAMMSPLPVKFPTIRVFLLLTCMLSCEKRSTEMDTSSPSREEASAAKAKPTLEMALAEKNLQLGNKVFIRAFKEEKTLEFFIENPSTGRFELFRQYPIAAASGTLGPKLAEGDRQVPEGFYEVPPSAMNPNSRFHLAFNIGYPNALDRSLSRTGSAIMIHGDRVSVGCLAMTDELIEEIYTLCEAAHQGGQGAFAVHIFPFRMTAQRLAMEKNSQWHAQWTNLKEGYDHFERDQRTPRVIAKGGRYHFKSTE